MPVLAGVSVEISRPVKIARGNITPRENSFAPGRAHLSRIVGGKWQHRCLVSGSEAAPYGQLPSSKF